MTIQELQQNFLSNKLVKQVFDKYTVMFIFIGGSYLTPFFDEKQSDYDINIFVKDKLPETRINQHENFFLEFQGKKIHWYINEFGNFFNQEFVGLVNLYVKCFNLTNDYLLYLDDKYKKYWEFLLEHKEQISQYNLFTSANIVHDDYIRSVVEHKSFLKTLYALFFGAVHFHLCRINDNQILYYKTNYNKLSVVEIDMFFQLYALIYSRLFSNKEYYAQLKNQLQQKLQELEG